MDGFSIVTSTIGTGRVRIALSKLIKATLFSGDPNVFLNAKSLVGRIPIGYIWRSPFYAKNHFPRIHRSGYCFRALIVAKLLKKYLTKTSEDRQTLARQAW